MAAVWPLQEAKNKLSELIDRAARGGPQVVTRHGRRVAVIISVSEYDRLRKPSKTLLEFLRSAPTAGLKLRIERDRSPGRLLDL